MASEIDICNLALSHLGDSATVSSIDPPEGSAQAEHCARFYPIARDSLLEMHSWGFATRRMQLAQVANAWPEWDYAYAMPENAVNIIAVLPPDATNDYTQVSHGANALQTAGGEFTPQDFACEIDDEGSQIILTDQPNAVLRFTTTINDSTKFSPLFTVTLSWHLASMLAGAVIKGDAGATQASRCDGAMRQYLSQAKTSDVGQRRQNLSHQVAWMNSRNAPNTPFPRQ